MPWELPPVRSELFLQFFLSFQGANTACRSVTVCGAVWASRSAASFSAVCAPAEAVASPEWSAAKSHTHCVYIFCVSFSRSFYSLRVHARAHACMTFTTYFVFLHRESESLPTVNAIHQCVMSRVVESDVYEWNLVFDHLLLFLFSLGPFSGVLSSTYILILPTFA